MKVKYFDMKRKIVRLLYIRSAVLVLNAAFVSLFCACSNLSDGTNLFQKQKNDNTEFHCKISGQIVTGAVPEELNGAFKSSTKNNNKMAYPEMPGTSDLKYEIKAVCDTEGVAPVYGTLADDKASYSIDITTPGFWTLTATLSRKVVNGTETDWLVIMSFQTEEDNKIEITPTSKIVPVNIELKSSQTGRGKINLAFIDNTTGHQVKVMTYQKDADGTTESEPINFVQVSTIWNSILELSDVDSGYSKYIFRFYNGTISEKGKLLYQCSEAVNVFDNMITNTWYQSGNDLHIDVSLGSTSFSLKDECLDAYSDGNIYVDTNAPSDGDGSEEKPFNTIEAAYLKYNSSSYQGVYTFHIKPGVYTVSSGIELTKSLNMICDSDDEPAEIKDIRSSSALNSDFFKIDTQNVEFKLKNVKLTTSISTKSLYGSNVCIKSTKAGDKIVLDNSQIVGFSGCGEGGAAINVENTEVQLVNGTVIDRCGITVTNSNYSYYGGAIYIKANSSLIINDAVIKECYIEQTSSSINSSSGSVSGGAIYIDSSSKCEILKGILTGNYINSATSCYGGALCCEGTLTLGDGRATTLNSAKGDGASDYYPDVIIGTGYYNGVPYNNANSITNTTATVSSAAFIMVYGCGVCCKTKDYLTPAGPFTMHSDVCVGCYDIFDPVCYGNIITANFTSVDGCGLYVGIHANSVYPEIQFLGGIIRNNCVKNATRAVNGCGLYFCYEKVNQFKNLDISYNYCSLKNEDGNFSEMFGVGLYAGNSLVIDDVNVHDNTYSLLEGSEPLTGWQFGGVGMYLRATESTTKFVIKKLIVSNNKEAAAESIEDDIFLAKDGSIFTKLTIPSNIDIPVLQKYAVSFRTDEGYFNAGTTVLEDETSGSGMVEKYYDRFESIVDGKGIGMDGKVHDAYYFDSTGGNGGTGTKTSPYSAFGSLSNVPTNSIIYLKGNFGIEEGIVLGSINYTFKKWTDDIPLIYSGADDYILFEIQYSNITFKDINLSGKIFATDSSTITLSGHTSIDYTSRINTDGEAIILNSSNLVLKDNATVSGGVTPESLYDDVLDIGVYARNSSQIKIQDSVQITGGCLYIETLNGSSYPTISITGPINYYGFKNQIYFDTINSISEHYSSSSVISGSLYIFPHSYSDYFDTHIDNYPTICNINADGKVELQN